MKPLLALLASIGILCLSVYQWRRSAPLLEGQYILEYARQEMQIPVIPLYHPKLILNGKHPALPSDSGEFHAVTVKQVPHWFLRASIYSHRTLCQVLRWPLIFSGIAAVLLFGLALLWQQSTQQDHHRGKLIRGPRIVTKLGWKLRMIGKKKGFYLETQ